MSVDADHVVTNLREQFDEVLAQLESVAGWKTAASMTERCFSSASSKLSSLYRTASGSFIGSAE